MKPTDDDGSGIPDEPQDELIAQIVPLRRRQDDTEHREQPHDESQATAHDTDDWSVFDPPEDLKLAERTQRVQRSRPDFDHDLAGEDLERSRASPPRARRRVLAFAGVVLTVIAITALAVLTLKGHAGASTRQPATPTPPVTLTSTSRALAAHPERTPAPRHSRHATQPSHRKPTKRKSSTPGLPQTATAGASTGEAVSAGRGSVDPSPTPARREPSSTQNAGSEFGIER